MRKFIIISTAVLGSLAWMAFLYAVGPADAARMTCEQKAACERRCAAPHQDYAPCIVRTCNKQYGTCGKG
ncbi:MAG TPA: hypothetical protein VH397_03915 [Xanthobacteraceae bacterium]|jgi:hypothetical protein